MKDGRRVAYYQFGAPDGIPMFFCHGTGSHVHAMTFHRAAEKFGYRIIAPDRPGIGLSDFAHQRTVLDGADDIARLADQLGIDRFGVIGISGGGPTLFACASTFPERLKFVVALACAAPLYCDPLASKELGRADRMYARLGRWLPRTLFQLPFVLLRHQSKKPASFAKMFASSMCPTDREAFENKSFQEMFIRDWQELFKRGSQGAALDAQLVYYPWGFDLRDIRCHIDIRHGSEDRWVPPSFSKYLERTLKDATLHMIEGQGHFYHMVSAEETFQMLAGRKPRIDSNEMIPEEP